MSDLATFTGLLDSREVAYRKIVQQDTKFTEIEVQNSPIERGYRDFVSIWEFDANGKLTGVGHYE